MKTSPRLLAGLLVVVAACALAGKGSRPARFYALTVTESVGDPAPGSWDVSLGLGPVGIPAYLDRPELVTRVGPNELRLDAGARWAEPLRSGVVRALQQEILLASGARRVVLYPWTSAIPVDLVVAVDLLRFERNADGGVELVARWSVRELNRGGALFLRESRLQERVDGMGTAAEVAALSRALGALGGEIATAAREATPPPRE